MEKTKGAAADNQTGAARIWELYQQGLQHHQRHSLYARAERCHRFYEGDQWYSEQGGLEGEELPIYNFIEPVVNYKTATVAMQNLAIHYSDMGGGAGPARCRALENYTARCWERRKMDARLWDMAREACITGSSYLYFFDADLNCQLLDGAALFLADEEQPDLQRQSYLLLMERLPVEQVKQAARRSGLEAALVDQIGPDSASPWWGAEQAQKSGGEEKCTSLLYLTKTPGGVTFCRSTKTVVYAPRQTVPGMKLYPMVSFLWKRCYHSARGRGEVWPLIPNQIEANKTLYRRLQAMKAAAFPKPVYVEGMVENPEDVTAVGSPVKVREGTVQKVSEVFTYLAPAGMSPDANLLQSELIGQSRELASAGDAALGIIDPTQASGTAIAAVREAQAVPLNEQTAAFRQMAEDVALVWLDLLAAYYPHGLTDGERAALDGLDRLGPGVRVDVSPADPFSRFAREQAAAAALEAGHITFAEYVQTLDKRSNAPKEQFEAILKQRRAADPGAEERSTGQ